MRTLIIEDEASSRESLVYLLGRYCPAVNLCGQAGGFEEGYRIFRNESPSVLFLDIQLNAAEGTGFDLLNLLDLRRCAVIFTSGHREYGAEAFRFGPVDYLLKPIRIDHLTEAVGKAGEFLDRLSDNDEPGTFHLPAADGFRLVRQHEIVRCEADGSYTRLSLGNGSQIVASVNLGQVAAKLGRDFLRVHKSHIVNRRYITGYTKGDALFVRMSDRSEVPVSRINREAFFGWIR
jgi:two-component system, LytTR family, response regulator